jgi:hypothetical protein
LKFIIILMMWLYHFRQLGSTDSFASRVSVADELKDQEDDEHVTQMETFPGRETLSRAISRRLSITRARSFPNFNAERSDVVVGVQIEESTVEVPPDSTDDVTSDPPMSATVSAPDAAARTLRSKGSSKSLSASSGRSWMSKWRSLSRRLMGRGNAG